MDKIFVIHYDCDCVGEHYRTMGEQFFLTEQEANRYIRENLVDNRQGMGMAEHQFDVEELELTTVNMKRVEKRNKHFRDQFK